VKKLAIDIGYSSTKILFEGKLHKLPSAISFATDLGIDYGEDDVIEYKGDKYYVGDAAVGLETFTTTSFEFKQNFDPVIIYHVLKKLKLVDDVMNKNVKLYLTLALADWKHKDKYLENLGNFHVDDKNVKLDDIVLLPQGAGAYMQFVGENGVHPSSAAVIDIGFNTINFLVYEGGQPKRAHSKGYSGHGVSSILRPFATYLESTFNMPFGESEALKIFTKGTFIFNGTEQEAIAEKIIELKGQFVKKLFNSVLVGDRKILSTSEKVILAGGGCYLLEGVTFPPNVILTGKPYEFANIVGVIS
jgi:plasmid segregation protein ParM